MSAAKKLFNYLKKDVKIEQPQVSATYQMLAEYYPLQSIQTKKQYHSALTLIEKLITFTNKENIADRGIETYIKTLGELISEYESQQWNSPTVSGSEMLAYLMDLKQLKQTDLAKELGGQSVVSKILKGERELNIRQVKALAKKFHISPEVFL